MAGSPQAVPGAPPVLRRPSALLWWALALLAVFVLMGFAVAADPSSPFPQPLDDWWRSVNGVSPDSGAYTWFLPMFFQYLGEAPGALVTGLLIPVLLALAGRWRSAVFFFAVIVLGPGLISQVGKNLVDRPRPAAVEGAGLYGPLFSVDHGSFPSGHCVLAAAVVFAIAALIPASRTRARSIWWAVGVAVMVGMMWQRTLINAHWLSDTMIGLVAGAAAALLLQWAFWPWLQSDHGRPVRLLHRAERTPDAV